MGSAGGGRVVGMDTGPCPIDGWGNGSELATGARWRRSGAGRAELPSRVAMKARRARGASVEVFIFG